MKSKSKRQTKKSYTLKEFKDTYLPNRDLETLENQEQPISRDAFLDILKKVSRPTQDQSDEGKKRTSE